MYLGKQSLLNRVFLNSKNSSFITLKDGKPNFLNNQNTFQLNRPKTEPGKINKIILDNKHRSSKGNPSQSLEKHLPS